MGLTAYHNESMLICPPDVRSIAAFRPYSAEKKAELKLWFEQSSLVQHKP
jgi:hypothetical protein